MNILILYLKIQDEDILLVVSMIVSRLNALKALCGVCVTGVRNEDVISTHTQSGGLVATN